MLTIRKENFREDEINVILDGLVPANHLVRKIENAIDFSFIYDKVKDLYSPIGAPSIDPVVLIKIVLIQYSKVNWYDYYLMMVCIISRFIETHPNRRVYFIVITTGLPAFIFFIVNNLTVQI